jgi:hypothetical protein
MSEPEQKPMTFDWSGRHRSSWMLALLIFGSLVLHSSAFLFVHIRTKERNVIPKTAQPIQLLTPFAPDGTPSPENEAVLKWIAAEDPSIVARVVAVEPEGLLDVPFRPSYLVSRTRPRDVPAEATTIQYPPARDSMEFILGADAKPAPALPPQRETVTQAFFRGALQSRMPSDTALTLAAKSPESLQTVELLVGVAATGEVRFCFVQSNSGVAEMDAEAVRLVSGIRLATSAEPMVWGEASIRWGSDAVAPKP